MITFLFAASVVLVTVLLVFELWQGSVLARHKFGFSFFRTSVWDPIFEQFGALPFIYGTLVTATLALLIAVPLGIGAAIFLAELAPARVSDTLEFFIDLLAAVPSVIYGVLGVFIVVPLMRQYVQPALKHSFGFLPLFQGPAYGVGFLTAGPSNTPIFSSGVQQVTMPTTPGTYNYQCLVHGAQMRGTITVQ